MRMAIYKASSGKVVKSLWVNSDTTSSFANQAVTLSESMRNFDLIGVRYNNSTSGTVSNIMYVEVDDFVQYIGTNKPRFFFGGYYTYNGSTNGYIRSCRYNSSDYEIFFNTTFMQGGGSATYNNMVIPTEIVGVKF